MRIQRTAIGPPPACKLAAPTGQAVTLVGKGRQVATRLRLPRLWWSSESSMLQSIARLHGVYNRPGTVTNTWVLGVCATFAKTTEILLLFGCAVSDIARHHMRLIEKPHVQHRNKKLAVGIAGFPDSLQVRRSTPLTFPKCDVGLE